MFGMILDAVNVLVPLLTSWHWTREWFVSVGVFVTVGHHAENNINMEEVSRLMLMMIDVLRQLLCPW